MKRKLFLIFIFALAVLLPLSFVCADTTDDAEINKINQEIKNRQDKIKKMEATMDTYKKQISQKITEAKSLKNQMNILDNRVAQIQVDVDLTETKIDKTQLEIDALALSIKDKETSIAKQKDIIKKIIQDLHTTGEKNYLEILLTNNSFSEFYSQVKNLESIYTDLGRSVKTLRVSKEDLDSKKQESEARKESYNQLKTQLENKIQDLNDQLRYRSNLLVQTKSSEIKYQSLLAAQKAVYEQTESEIRSYENKARQLIEAAKNKKNAEDLGDPTKMSWPVPSHYITAEFHDSTYAFRNVFEHNAIDVRAAYGTPIKAAAAGYVARAKRCTTASCYSYVLLAHDDDLSTAYGHMSQIIVNEDQFVERGQVIGYSGGTPGTVGAGPYTTAAHLHFEVRKNGIPVNPVNYLSPSSN